MINKAPVDRFTLAHGGVGAVYGLVRFPWWVALTLGVGWELVEIELKKRIPIIFPYASQDTLPNATIDVIAVMIGWAVGRKIRG